MKNVKLRDIGRLFLYLFVVSAFTTTNMLLFFDIVDFELEEQSLRIAGIITLLNVIGITVIIWLIDRRWRVVMIDRPVRRIQAGISKVIAGDLSTRISTKSIGNSYEYASVIDGINQMITELGSVETLRTDFVANVSHELKTPLSVIQNYGTLLQSPELSEEDRLEYAKSITASSRRLANLIANILKLNKLENQQIFPEMTEYDLSESLCESLLQFENVWEEKNIDIETDMEDGVAINADKELFDLVWSNLFSNAMKFTEPGGKVGVTLRKDGESAVVTVSDTGCGMSENTVKHIFDKFYQGDTSHASQGNGLGLALAKRVIDIHGGTIEVESEPEKGSTFTVRLKRE